MNKRTRKIPFNISVFIISAYIVSLFVVSFDLFITVDYDIAVGRVAQRTFQAGREIENIYVTNMRREAEAAAVAPLIAHNSEITEQIMINVDTLFGQLGYLRAVYMPLITPAAPLASLGELPPNMGLLVELNDEQFAYIIRSSSADFSRFFTEIRSIFEERLAAGISEGVYNAILSVIHDEVRSNDYHYLFVEIAVVIFDNLLMPNHTIDQELLAQQRQVAMDNIEPVVFQVGQNVVSAGEIITEEAFMALVELGYADPSVGVVFASLAGSMLLIIIIFTVAIFYIYLFQKDILENKRQILLIFTLYTITVILSRIMHSLPFYLTPIMLFAMLTAILLDLRLSIFLTILVSLVAILIDSSDIAAIIYILISGVFASMIAKYVITRGKVFAAAISLALINILTVFAIHFIFYAGITVETANYAIFSLIGGILTIILCIGSLPFWEFAFKITTPNTLIELTNPSNVLLQRLTIEAPGTYHHSLVVANLSEAASHAIGANHILARVGSYFHDIGKMKYPQYFAENQNGLNPHDALRPIDSAAVIIDHITRGLEMAKEYKLPHVVADFIEQHHGSTLIKYFYFKAKEATPDKEIDEIDFRYPYPIPKTREVAVVMLADTCEAAVRSTISKGLTSDEIESFVRKLIKEKMEDGQLNDSALSIKDLDIIATAFMRVFKGMYHERIPYPSSELVKES